MGYRAMKILSRLIPCLSRRDTKRQRLKVHPFCFASARKRRYRDENFIAALKTEEILVLNDFDEKCDHPVINIGFGLDDEDLIRKAKPKHRSYCRTHWDEVLGPSLSLLDCDTEESQELIIDGLPASIWEDCMEPSLSALVSLSSLKHRKTNFTKTKKASEISPSGRIERHGDTNLGLGPVFMVYGAGIHVNTAADVVNLHRHFLNNQRPESSLNLKAQLHANRHLRHRRNNRVFRRYNGASGRHQKACGEQTASDRWVQERKRAKRARSTLYDENRQQCQSEIGTTSYPSVLPDSGKQLEEVTESTEEQGETGSSNHSLMDATGNEL